MIALDRASMEELGRELARRVVQRFNVANSARAMSQASNDLVEIADAAEMALTAAAQASDMAVAARMLLGHGDVELAERTSRLAKEAAGAATFCSTRWGLVRRQRGQEARA